MCIRDRYLTLASHVEALEDPRHGPCAPKIPGSSVLLTTKNSDDLEIRVPDGSRSLKVTPVNSSRVISYQSLIVREAVSCTVYEI